MFLTNYYAKVTTYVEFVRESHWKKLKRSALTCEDVIHRNIEPT